jgi:agmatine deiminase
MMFATGKAENLNISTINHTHYPMTPPITPTPLAPTAPVTIALIQMAMSDDLSSNLARACDRIRVAVAAGAEVVVLPELFRTPYFCVQNFQQEAQIGARYGEVISDRAMMAIGELAGKLGVVIVAGSFYEAGRYNTAAVFDVDGSLCGTYRKSHIPQDPGFYEQEYFEPGDTGFMVFDTAKLRVSVLICFDQWFPEAARCATLQGAELLVYPTAIGNVDSCGQPTGHWQEAWEISQRAHAIANSVPVAVANRVGSEGESRFWGGSFVCDAFGKILAKGGVADEIVLATIDRNHGPTVCQEWGFIRNRRPDLYGAIVAPVVKKNSAE